jgi:hypothetical protein
VAVWSCPPRNCQFREGAHWLEQRLMFDRKTALPEAARARVLLLQAGPGEERAALAALAAFRAALAAAAPTPLPAAGEAAPARRVAAGRRLLGGVSLSIGALSLLAVLSTAHTGSAATAATLRLAWTHDTGLLERCRTLTTEELAARPPHMRTPRLCERRYPALRVLARVDGDTLLDTVVQPGGAQLDRPPAPLFDVKVARGARLVEVTAQPVLSADEAGAAPRSLSTSVDMVAGGIYRVRWQRDRDALVLEVPR